MRPTPPIDPDRLPRPPGDPAQHLDAEALAAGYAELPPPPRDAGTLRMIVARAAGGVRRRPPTADLAPDRPLPGDRWRPGGVHGTSNQLTAARYDFTELVANGQDPALAGDNLLINLDLSEANLPIGSLLTVGGALLRVTPKPHHGCAQYRQRFGAPALRMASHPEWTPLHLRGVHLEVVEGGPIAVGDPVRVEARGITPDDVPLP